jgi:hypothetical protein
MDSFCTDPDDSRELLHPLLASFNLHRPRVRRASGFLLTAFSNATPHTFFSVEHLSRVASEKALALYWSNCVDLQDRIPRLSLLLTGVLFGTSMFRT